MWAFFGTDEGVAALLEEVKTGMSLNDSRLRAGRQWEEQPAKPQMSASIAPSVWDFSASTRCQRTQRNDSDERAKAPIGTGVRSNKCRVAVGGVGKRHTRKQVVVVACISVKTSAAALVGSATAPASYKYACCNAHALNKRLPGAVNLPARPGDVINGQIRSFPR